MANYDRNYARGYAGQLSNTNHLCMPFVNGAGAALEAGVMVVQKASTEGSADLCNQAHDVMLGIVVNSLERPTNSITGEGVYNDKDVMDVMTEGCIYVLPEETVTVADPVYVRITSDGGSNTVLGKFRKSSDSGKAVLLKGARWTKGGTTSSVAEVYFSATAQQAAGDIVEFSCTHPAVTADTTTKEFKTRPDRFFKVTGARYINPTGLAQDATNVFNIKLQYGSTTVIAQWDTTTTTGQGTIAADTFVEMVLNATPANLVLAPDTVISLFLDEGGNASLPAGKVVLQGQYI